MGDSSAVQDFVAELTTWLEGQGVVVEIERSSVSQYIQVWERGDDLGDGDWDEVLKTLRVSNHDLPSRYDRADYHIELSSKDSLTVTKQYMAYAKAYFSGKVLKGTDGFITVPYQELP